MAQGAPGPVQVTPRPGSEPEQLLEQLLDVPEVVMAMGTLRVQPLGAAALP